MSKNYTDEEIVEKLEEKFPEMTGEFKEIMSEQYLLFCKKQWDYGPSNIAMGTSLTDKDDIKLSMTGLIIRMNDKIQRLINLVIKTNQQPANESTQDAFSDLSVYGIIAQIVTRGKWAK